MLQPRRILRRVHVGQVPAVLRHKLPGSRLFGPVEVAFFEVAFAVDDRRAITVLLEQSIEIR